MANETYEVTAPVAVLEHEPGDKFEADLDPVQRERLLDGGHLKVVKASAPKAPPVVPQSQPSE